MIWVHGVAREHPAEFEYELIRQGLRWRDVRAGRIALRDAWVVAQCAPVGSPLAIALDERAAWGPGDHLLANIFDALQGLIFGLGGGKGREPKPIGRPGYKPEGQDNSTYRGDPLTIDEADALRSRFRRRGAAAVI